MTSPEIRIPCLSRLAGAPACAALVLLIALAPSAMAQVDDATVLALELDGPGGIIRVDPDLVAAIDGELALTRGQLPNLAGIHVHPSWMPGEIIVGMTEAAFAAFLDGTFTGFDDLLAAYPLAGFTPFSFIEAVHMVFVEPLHPENLALLFAAIDGVTYAEPNHVGGDGDDITIEALGSYVFKRGWGDCPSGCIYNHYWRVEIQDGTAVIVEEWGDELPVAVQAASWSALKARMR
jgi:hypothetical protein